MLYLLQEATQQFSKNLDRNVCGFIDKFERGYLNFERALRTSVFPVSDEKHQKKS